MMRVAMLGGSYQSALLPYARTGASRGGPQVMGQFYPSTQVTYGQPATLQVPTTTSGPEWLQAVTGLANMGLSAAMQIIAAKRAQTTDPDTLGRLDQLERDVRTTSGGGLDQNTLVLLIGGGLLLLVVGGVIFTRKRR